MDSNSFDDNVRAITPLILGLSAILLGAVVTFLEIDNVKADRAFNLATNALTGSLALSVSPFNRKTRINNADEVNIDMEQK